MKAIMMILSLVAPMFPPKGAKTGRLSLPALIILIATAILIVLVLALASGTLPPDTINLLNELLESLFEVIAETDAIGLVASP